VAVVDGPAEVEFLPKLDLPLPADRLWRQHEGALVFSMASSQLRSISPA
jgi:hypothetical protein